MNSPIDWLQTTGDAWIESVIYASLKLLNKYRQHFPTDASVNLQALAASLEAEVVWQDYVAGGARLIPSNNGFIVLISRQTEPNRYKTTIAHELAHTLFYTREEGKVKRLTAPSDREEHFCFDVARRLLVPDWSLDSLGINKMYDAKQIFNTLVCELNLSKDISARIMLSDYELVCGVAGRYKKDAQGWKLCKGYSYASPSLKSKASQKKLMHHAARQWLLDGSQPKDKFFNVIGIYESLGEMAFVIVETL
jgi:Zn-dependent peptidase ImmA (M78 family)